MMENKQFYAEGIFHGYEDMQNYAPYKLFPTCSRPLSLTEFVAGFSSVFFLA